MKVNELRHLANDQVIEVELEGEDVNEFNLEDTISIYLAEDEYIVEQNGHLAIVNNNAEFNAFGDINHFIWIPLSLNDNRLTLQVIPCLPSQLNFEDIDAAIDDKIVQQVVERANLTENSVDAVSVWLKEQFILHLQGRTHLLLATNRNKRKNRQSAVLTMVGSQYLLQVEIKPDNTLWVNTLTSKPRNANFDLNLLSANISFVDSTLAARINDSSLKQKLDDLEKNNTAYIQLWDEYNQKVKEKAVELAKQAKFVRFIKCQPYESVDGVEWRFYYKEKDQNSVGSLCAVIQENKGSLVEISHTLPGWLENDSQDDLLGNEQENKGLKARFVRKTNQYIVLELREYGKPSSQGVIFLSISGSIVQMKRREKARDAITRLINPMPGLRFLIEDLDFDSGRNNYRTLKPLTPAARKAFKGTPTEKQIEALDVALNTPDIALILGPPGTGKTQIISALQNRLAESAGKNFTAEILLSSFQNDAVDNVVARSQAFGIPSIRGDDDTQALALLEQWSKKQEYSLKEKASHLSQLEGSYKIIKNINADIATLLSKTVDQSVKKTRFTSLLEDANLLRVEHGFDIPLDLLLRLKECHNQSVISKSDNQSTRVLRSIRALRTTMTSYNDDGAEQCWLCSKALRRMDSYRNSEEVKFLEQLSDSFEPVTVQQLRELRDLKNELLDKFIPDYRPITLQSQVSVRTTGLLNELADLIKTFSESCSAGIPDVIEEYLETIKYQPQQLASCIASYAASVGASCQRSQSKKLSSYKQTVQASLDEITNDLNFDTVIIDEAARANPLDLFIPMALAKRRIVLVGDHFQLPQMLEPDIEKEMSQAGSLRDETADAIKKSLFERLYTQLKEREAKDGIKRTVMLDTQFRMHPKIGDFVSRSFYESEGESKVKAGLPKEYFDLGIGQYAGKIAEWVDVPLTAGKERRAGTSWQRQCEAEKVADEVEVLLTESQDLSIGVITFFASQRERIFEQLARKGICNNSKDGWEYMPGYKTLANGEERLRVGTVDAFQGKEFDVVILSTVRSNDYAIIDENSLRRKYGFIRTLNRLNVAFSRAKSLIKVVGDKAMFSSDDARQAIPPVWAFINELCEEL